MEASPEVDAKISKSKKNLPAWDHSKFKKVSGKNFDGDEVQFWIPKRNKVWTEKSKIAFENCRKQLLLKKEEKKRKQEEDEAAHGTDADV